MNKNTNFGQYQTSGGLESAKVLLGLLVLGSFSSFAGWREAQLVCSRNGEHLVSVSIPSVEINDMRQAKLTKDLDGYEADIGYYVPNSKDFYNFALSFDSNVPLSISLKDYYVLRDREGNMVLENNSVRFGYYGIEAGYIYLHPRGASVLDIEVLREDTVYYDGDSSTPRKLDDVAIATIKFDNNEQYRALCSFRFYGE